jgi:Domain of unknown function (DUF4253)
MTELRSIVAPALRCPLGAVAVLALCGAPGPALAGMPPARVADPIVLRAPKSFAAAVAMVEKATGVKADPFEAAKTPVPPSEGRSFALDSKIANRLLAGSHSPFRKAGFYLFRYERGFGLPGEHDRVGLLATADRDAVVRRMRTAEGRGGATTEGLIGWLRQVEKATPFELPEIGVDYVAGRFTRAPKDPEAMARRTTEIAPALVTGGDREVLLLAEEIRANRTLYLIW